MILTSVKSRFGGPNVLREFVIAHYGSNFPVKKDRKRSVGCREANIWGKYVRKKGRYGGCAEEKGREKTNGNT